MTNSFLPGLISLHQCMTHINLLFFFFFCRVHPCKHASIHMHTQTHTHYLDAEQRRQHMSLNPIVFPLSFPIFTKALLDFYLFLFYLFHCFYICPRPEHCLSLSALWKSSTKCPRSGRSSVPTDRRPCTRIDTAGLPSATPLECLPIQGHGCVPRSLRLLRR